MTEFETELRTWMEERAARVHASPRLLGAGYHPRRRAPSRTVIGGGLAIAATALTAVLTLAGGASNAFAGWTARPTTATPAQLAAAKGYCHRNMSQKGLPLKLTDTRGPFMILIYANAASNDFCSVGPSFRNTSAWTSSPPVRPPSRKLFLWTDHTATIEGQSYGSMIAQAGVRVVAATLILDDGSKVTATVSHGWVAAWWPGAHHVATAHLTTTTGTQTQPFPRYPCDVHRCGRGSGPHGSAPDGGPGGA